MASLVFFRLTPAAPSAALVPPRIASHLKKTRLFSLCWNIERCTRCFPKSLQWCLRNSNDLFSKSRAIQTKFVYVSIFRMQKRNLHDSNAYFEGISWKKADSNQASNTVDWTQWLPISLWNPSGLTPWGTKSENTWAEYQVEYHREEQDAGRE